MPHTSTNEESNERSPLLARRQSSFSDSTSSISIVPSSTLGASSSDNHSSRSFPKPPADEESDHVSDAAAGDSQRPSTASVAQIIVVLLIGTLASQNASPRNTDAANTKALH
jgi:hypothetical protein